MHGHKIIVIGASSGGVEALTELFQKFQPTINAAILVVLHLSPNARSRLPDILSRRSLIPVKQAKNHEKIVIGHAYIAPPDQHMLVFDDTIYLSFGPEINHTRPAIDPLFESAAASFGAEVIGVILSGALYDGTKGLMGIKKAGGIAVVQDPQEASYPDMPESAIQFAPVDYILPVREISSLLNSLAEPPATGKGESQMSQPTPGFDEDETSFIKKDIESYEKGDDTNQRSVLTCPDCGGVLWEIKDGQLLRYRCHTGHVFNAENIISILDDGLEKSFWTTLRLLIEKAAVSNRLAMNAENHGEEDRKEYYVALAKEAVTETERVRSTWLNGRAKKSKDQSAGEQVNHDLTGAAG
jgi:two-component system, chemotaxis family, protein-glutamate methylesterase/glutaminase